MEEIFLLIGKDAKGRIKTIRAYKTNPFKSNADANLYTEDIPFWELRPVVVED